MSDLGFPVIEYTQEQTARERGRMHGEAFRDGIRELYDIRIDLMREKNPSMDDDRIADLALQQWMASEVFDRDLTMELQGICDGSNMSREEIVVLNNYTDFRDIQLDDQGCSVVYANYGAPIAGQTWDMHGTARDYVCCIKVPDSSGELESVVFSLVGCVGMMGYTSQGTVVGVNNINTNRAKVGTMWPVLVRKMLTQKNYDSMIRTLEAVNVASGHHYLVASNDAAGMWEVMPELCELVESKSAGEEGSMFHTNHCLGREAATREVSLSQTSTTHIRFNLIQKKIGAVRTYEDVYALLNDHENYPKSICSAWQSSAQDPSITCGGAVGDLASGRVQMWRGDEIHDDNFVIHDFQLKIAAGVLKN